VPRVYIASILLAGAAVLMWQFALMGTPPAYLAAERHWGVKFAWPWHVAQWHLNGWVVGQPSTRGWLGLHNGVFAVVSAAGTVFLFRDRRYADGWFSLVLVVIALSVIRTPVLSRPRLLLGAFPATAALGDRVSGWGPGLGYAALALAGAIYIIFAQLTFFFA